MPTVVVLQDNEPVDDGSFDFIGEFVVTVSVDIFCLKLGSAAAVKSTGSERRESVKTQFGDAQVSLGLPGTKDNSRKAELKRNGELKRGLKRKGESRVDVCEEQPYGAITRDPHELIPSSPSWAVDTYPLGSVYHRVFLYHNERVGHPYGYIYIIDHPTWRTIVPLDEHPANVPQEEDLHMFIALNGDLAPHPAEYTDSITNRLFY
ncbi:hypothetical protein EDB86DRAFT_3090698 [Lactarius hatsudake]|nr:hypothetical protein EDB86DRAFT_3090698 [Lactarius hatsudake]